MDDPGLQASIEADKQVGSLQTSRVATTRVSACALQCNAVQQDSLHFNATRRAALCMREQISSSNGLASTTKHGGPDTSALRAAGEAGCSHGGGATRGAQWVTFLGVNLASGGSGTGRCRRRGAGRSCRSGPRGCCWDGCPASCSAWTPRLRRPDGSSVTSSVARTARVGVPREPPQNERSSSSDNNNGGGSAGSRGSCSILRCAPSSVHPPRSCLGLSIRQACN